MNTTWLKAIQARIKTVSAVTNQTYFELAPTSASFPYVVYSYVGSITEYDKETFNLNIDVWYKGTDTTVLEDLTKSIRDALQKYSYVGTGVGFVLFHENTMMILDPNELIKRRRLTFNANTFYN